MGVWGGQISQQARVWGVCGVGFDSRFVGGKAYAASTALGFGQLWALEGTQEITQKRSPHQRPEVANRLEASWNSPLSNKQEVDNSLETEYFYNVSFTAVVVVVVVVVVVLVLVIALVVGGVAIQIRVRNRLSKMEEAKKVPGHIVLIAFEATAPHRTMPSASLTAFQAKRAIPVQEKGRSRSNQLFAESIRDLPTTCLVE